MKFKIKKGTYAKRSWGIGFSIGYTTRDEHFTEDEIFLYIKLFKWFICIKAIKS